MVDAKRILNTYGINIANQAISIIPEIERIYCDLTHIRNIAEQNLEKKLLYDAITSIMLIENTKSVMYYALDELYGQRPTAFADAFKQFEKLLSVLKKYIKTMNNNEARASLYSIIRYFNMMLLTIKPVYNEIRR